MLDESQRIDVREPVEHSNLWGDRRDIPGSCATDSSSRVPVSVNGVAISDTERRHAEEDYLRQAKARDRQHGGERGRASGPDAAPDAAAPDVESLIKQTRQPGFVDSGVLPALQNRGRGTRARRPRDVRGPRRAPCRVLYPTKLFSHEENKQQRDERQGATPSSQDQSAAIEQMMNKAALITLWIEPKAFQIVKYTFDNVNVDFFPGAWLFRVTAVTASMTMNQPIAGKPEIWLPRDLDVAFGGDARAGPGERAVPPRRSRLPRSDDLRADQDGTRRRVPVMSRAATVLAAVTILGAPSPALRLRPRRRAAGAVHPAKTRRRRRRRATEVIADVRVHGNQGSRPMTRS